jgi:hypothetical protein
MSSLRNDLEKKINLQRGVNSYFEQRGKLISILIKTVLIVLPAFLTFIAFSDFVFLKYYVPSLSEETLRLIIGLISFSLFIIGVISEVFNVTVVHERHRESIEQYSALLREMKELPPQCSEEQLKLLNQKYTFISGSSPSISPKDFNKAESFHLKNELLRDARKADPFGCTWDIRKKAKELSKNK